jgi:hypothetical protein
MAYPQSEWVGSRALAFLRQSLAQAANERACGATGDDVNDGLLCRYLAMVPLLVRGLNALTSPNSVAVSVPKGVW